ncbi:MAG: rod shape-determining protein MreC [Ruminococcaceae bacterium]|nr:rod shape-determining protein MreC [Oscillospiraceae bacterium]
MKSFWKSFLAKAVGVLALILIGVMIYSATTGGLATIPETIAGTFITPIQSLFSGLSDGVSDLFDGLTGGGDLQDEVEALRKENAELRKKLVDYDRYKQENDWYSDILGLHEQNADYTFASGRVIGRDPSDVYGNFTISAGSNADIEVNDPVISTDGYLIGVVDEVGLTYAKVRTILDTTSRVSAQISRTGDTGYTAGGTLEQVRRRTIRLTTLERSSGVAIGDDIVTSGIGGVYPGGLLLGSVRSVAPASDGMTLDAEIELFADIYNLKQVMVITSFDGQGSSHE